MFISLNTFLHFSVLFIFDKRQHKIFALFLTSMNACCAVSWSSGMCTRIIAPWSWPVTLRMMWTAGNRLSYVPGSILRRPPRFVNSFILHTVGTSLPGWQFLSFDSLSLSYDTHF